MRKSLAAILFASSAAFSSGCGTIYNELASKSKEDQELIQEGYNPVHAKSCGPCALSFVYIRKGDNIEAKDVSKDILRHGEAYNVGRNLISVFSVEGAEITFPSEIINSLRRHGYQVKIRRGSQTEMKEEINKMTEENRDGIARLEETLFYQHYEPIPPILKKRKDDEGNYHYERVDLINYFGPDTYISEIYEVKTPFHKEIELYCKIKGRELVQDMKEEWMKGIIKLAEFKNGLEKIAEEKN